MSRRRETRSRNTTTATQPHDDRGPLRCARCGGQTPPGAHLCRDHTRTLDIALRRIAEHHTDLDTVRAGLARYGETPTRRSSGTPIGMNPLTGAQADDEHHVRTLLVGWVRHTLETWPEQPWPADTVPGMARWLRARLHALLGRPEVEQLYADALTAEQTLARLVDRPPARWYAGRCGARRPGDPEGVTCTAELYARDGKPLVRCSACHTQHHVADRRDTLLREAADQLVTATEAAYALTAWTEYAGSTTSLVDRIRKWRDRGRIEARGTIHHRSKDRDLYRLGDVQARLVDDAQRTQQRRIGA